MARDVRDPAVQVCIAPDLDTLNRQAADEIVRLSQGHRRFSLVLAGGSTPRSLYTMLAGEPYHSRIPWECINLFWGDERCVPPDHPDSNFRMVQETLLAHVPLPQENIHRIPADQGSPEAAAAAYERIIKQYFQLEDGELPEFDLVLLGLGEDGHTASLFPRAAAVYERRRLAVATSGGNPNLPRVTLTVPVLNHARRLLWLVTGAQKAPIVRKVLKGPEQLEEIPAQRVRALQGTSLWLLDHEAAKEVSVDFSGNGDPANA